MLLFAFNRKLLLVLNHVSLRSLNFGHICYRMFRRIFDLDWFCKRLTDCAWKYYRLTFLKIARQDHVKSLQKYKHLCWFRSQYILYFGSSRHTNLRKNLQNFLTSFLLFLENITRLPIRIQYLNIRIFSNKRTKHLRIAKLTQLITRLNLIKPRLTLITLLKPINNNFLFLQHLWPRIQSWGFLFNRNSWKYSEYLIN